MRGGWRGFLLLALAALVVGAAQTSAGHGMLRDLGLFQVPPAYTELAFTDPQGLPLQLDARQAPIKVSFQIHNASGFPHSYHWSIALTRAGKSQRKAAGVASVPANGSVTVDKTVSMSCAGGRLRVVVGLAESTERIGFWTACQAKPGSATKGAAK